MRYIAADRIFDGRRFLPNDAVLVYNDSNLFQQVLPADSVDPTQVQRFEGILCPGFVNAHCHLELSHLKGLIPQHTTLPLFGPQVVQKRALAGEEEVLERMFAADQEMFNQGIVAVGDISNTNSSFSVKARSLLRYHTFIELIGFNKKTAEAVFEKGKLLLNQLNDKGMAGSLAPHAPYSCSQELISLISVFDSEHHLPFCIHNQESEEETRFFTSNESGFYDLYRTLNIDISWWKPTGNNSLAWYVHLLKPHRTLLVHNTVSHEADLAMGGSLGVYWCLCPGANLYIEGRLPDLSLFKKYSDRLCIGTDSLASNSQLSVVNELNLLLADGRLELPELLRAATANGAEALGLPHEYGTFLQDRNSGLMHLDFISNKLIFKKRIL